MMETTESLDADIVALQSRLTTLHAHRANLSSILLSQPHLSSHLQLPSQPLKPNSTPSTPSTIAQNLIAQQATRNTSNIYRTCAGVTAYKVQDPDPNAINGGAILGISIDVSLGGNFIETYHVLLNYREREGKKVLRVHKHTIPPCIPLQQLVNKWLPAGEMAKEGQEQEQDLVRFGRTLRKEIVGWHLRVDAFEVLRKEAGVGQGKKQSSEEAQEMGRVLNAFMSDDDRSSDVEEEDDVGPMKIVDIEADAAVRQITIRWSDRRTALMNITKDGRIEKAVCRLKDGSRDVAMGRKAIGPMTGLVRRMAA